MLWTLGMNISSGVQGAGSTNEKASPLVKSIHNIYIYIYIVHIYIHLFVVNKFEELFLMPTLVISVLRRQVSRHFWEPRLSPT